ncbi:uncharacterized protein [Parasteatoda tepidariorum]|uniref:uncharacterized protein n=1 Tax=Parasteatoda tepidariorum TaxID=114398 RepID=UPI00077FB755|nr:uncharacterized protein LOC107451908 [Parasteatoda tepidariorum]
MFMKHIKVLLLFTSIPALFQLLVEGVEDCDVGKQRRCRQVLVTELDKQSHAAKDLELQCRKLEDNLNCMVLQIIKCPTPNKSGELINRAWKFMQDNCDSFGGWWSYDCFHLEDMKKCEKIFALRDAPTSQASCREYDRFRHCTSDVIKKQCDSEDIHSMGNYLLDSAGDMIWTCPPQPDPIKSPMVDKGFVGVLPTLAVPAIAEESHLRSVYSSALTGESPFVSGCNARATEEMRGCLDRHQYERDQALGARDDEDRLRKECCATWNYRRCLQNAVRIHCYDTREVDVQSAIDVIPHDRGFLCRNHWIYTCSGAINHRSLSSWAHILLFITISIYASVMY